MSDPLKIHLAIIIAETASRCDPRKTNILQKYCHMCCHMVVLETFEVKESQV